MRSPNVVSLALPAPTTAGQLAKFVHAANWMRNTIAGFGPLFQPLYDVMNASRLLVGSSSTKKLEIVALDSRVGWDSKLVDRFKSCQKAIANQIEQAYHDPEAELFVFCDASDTGNRVVVLPALLGFNPFEAKAMDSG